MAHLKKKDPLWNKLPVDPKNKNKKIVKYVHPKTFKICQESCFYKDLEVDHIIPRNKNDSDDIENLQLLPSHINRKKSDKLYFNGMELKFNEESKKHNAFKNKNYYNKPIQIGLKLLIKESPIIEERMGEIIKFEKDNKIVIIKFEGNKHLTEILNKKKLFIDYPKKTRNQNKPRRSKRNLK
tara:strand:- start:425 stop:970 length:546 start_codon:yes stop_codon:yes gene_type:complete